MENLLSVVAQGMLRAVLLVGAMWGSAQLLSLGDDGEGGANIGAGLLAFALMGVVSGIWAFFDGRSANGLRYIAAAWTVAWLLASVGIVLSLWRGMLVGKEPWNTALIADDLLTLTPVFGVFILLPAVLGSIAGLTWQRRTLPGPTP